MVTAVNAQISFPDGACRPDRAPTNDSFYPKQNFVVSRQCDGVVISRFGSLLWDLSPYDGRGEYRVIDFSFWGTEAHDARRRALVKEAQRLMFILIWRRKHGTLSAATLYGYSRSIACMARFCYERYITIKELISNKRHAVALVAKFGSQVPKKFLGITSVLRELDSTKTGFSVMSAKDEAPIRTTARAIADRTLQFAPLPTRIYENLISGLVREISDFEKIEADLLELLRIALERVKPGNQLENRDAASASLTEEGRLKLMRGSVSSELQIYLDQRGLKVTKYSLIKVVTRMQLICKTFLHVFSGARDKEVEHIPYDCLRNVVVDGIRYYLLLSTTSKFENGIPKDDYWVTCAESQKAVACAQRLCEFIYAASRRIFPRQPRKMNQAKTPLFLSSAYLLEGGRRPKRANRPGGLDLTINQDIFKDFGMAITDDDVAELEAIDRVRAWRADAQFKVGAIWRLQTHQLRRSLGLYGKSSGLIRPTSLRRQFKQVELGMAEYYARGSESAKDILKRNPKHMCGVYQASEAEAEALFFLRNLVQSEEQWSGPLATFVNTHLRSDSGLISESLQDIKLQVERGQIAYRETHLGGCGEPGDCKKRAMRSIVSCLGCPKGGINETKLDGVIEAQANLVSTLVPNTMEHSTEAEDLRALKAYRKKNFN